MFTVLATNKKGNRIVSYTCKDGTITKVLSKEQLASLIDRKLVTNATKQIYDGKLIIRIKDKVNIQNKGTRNPYNDVARAILLIDSDLRDMGYDYEAVVEMVCCDAGITLDYVPYNELAIYHLKAINKLLVSNPNRIIAYVNNYICTEDNADILRTCIENEANKSYTDSKTYIALVIILNYLKSHSSPKELINSIQKIVLDASKTAVKATKLGKEIGHSYYAYLDKKLFGSISNDSYTVGHSIKPVKLNDYTYVLNKTLGRLGAPEVSVRCEFKNGDNNSVIADFSLIRIGYISERSVSAIGVLKKAGRLTLNAAAPFKENAKLVADYMNKLVPMIYTLADNYQSLYKCLHLGAKIENISGKLSNLTNIKLLDLAVARYYESMCNKPVEIKISEVIGVGNPYVKIDYRNTFTYRKETVFVEAVYTGMKFSLRLINTKTNKVENQVEAVVSGLIKDNSLEIASAITELVIKTK